MLKHYTEEEFYILYQWFWIEYKSVTAWSQYARNDKQTLVLMGYADGMGWLK